MEYPSHDPDDLMRMPKGKLVEAFVAVAGRLAPTEAELAEAKSLDPAYARRIEELQRSAGKNGRNSGMPPSSDGLSKPTVEEVSQKRARSLRGKSNRNPGGRPGHPGGALWQVETPDEVVDHFPRVREHCHARLPKGLASRGYARRQVHDLPPPQEIHVVEHRAHSCPCPKCGKIAKAPFPGDVAGPVQYGKRIEACVAYPAASSSSCRRGSPTSWRTCSTRGSRKPRFRR